MTDPILTYPDPNLPYVLFIDASKYAWACVLTQKKTQTCEEKRKPSCCILSHTRVDYSKEVN